MSAPPRPTPKRPQSSSGRFATVLAERYKKGDYDGVVRLATERLKLKPQDGDALIYLAKVRLRDDDFAGVQQALKRLSPEARSSTAARIVEGTLLLHTNQSLQAMTILNQAAADAPRNHEVLVVLGNAAQQAKQLKRAMESFQKALALAPNDGGTHAALGLAYLESKDKRSIAHLQTAVKFAPKDARLAIHLAEALILFGKRSDAERALAAALRVLPTHAELKFAYEKVKAMRPTSGLGRPGVPPVRR